MSSLHCRLLNGCAAFHHYAIYLVHPPVRKCAVRMEYGKPLFRSRNGNDLRVKNTVHKAGYQNSCHIPISRDHDCKLWSGSSYAFSIVAHVYLDVFRKTVAGVTAPHGCSAIEYGIRLNAIIEDIYNFVLKLGDS